VHRRQGRSHNFCSGGGGGGWLMFDLPTPPFPSSRSSSFPSPSLPLPSPFLPPNPARGLGSAVSSGSPQRGPRVEPRPQTHFDTFMALKTHLIVTSFPTFRGRGNPLTPPSYVVNTALTAGLNARCREEEETRCRETRRRR